MPSGNIPGSAGSRRRTGEGSRSRWLRARWQRLSTCCYSPGDAGLSRRGLRPFGRPLQAVAILGYGNQGRAQALNLRDSGVQVTIALAEASRRREQARAEGFPVMTAAEAAAGAGLVVMLAADEDHGRIYDEEVAPNLREGAALGFAHGLSIRFGLVAPREDLDVFLVAPKGPGTALRQDYL